MNTANYTSTVTSSGGEVNKYPLSTESLAFIQSQIRLLEHLAGLGGQNYILYPDRGNNGVVALTNKSGNMEVLELMDSPAFSSSTRYINVTTTSEDVTADGEVYVGARVFRRARFSSFKGMESYDINEFVNVSGKRLLPFPTNQTLAERIKNMPNVVLNYLKDDLAGKLTSSTISGMTAAKMDSLLTSGVYSCMGGIALFGMSDYTIIVTEQGARMVRQELIQGLDRHYVRTWDGESWGAWTLKTETVMHIEVKVSGGTVYLRHGALPADCDIILLRKKKRGGWRRTGGENALDKNKGKKVSRSAKSQYVHFKGITLSKGVPGKWYVPKCTSVKDRKLDSGLIGKELPGICSSLFYLGQDGLYRIQGCRKKIVTKDNINRKHTQHAGYVRIGIQIARLNRSGGKDSGGEIIGLKYRVSQQKLLDDGRSRYVFRRTFSIE